MGLSMITIQRLDEDDWVAMRRFRPALGLQLLFDEERAKI
jgi:hypothetical protein